MAYFGDAPLPFWAQPKPDPSQLPLGDQQWLNAGLPWWKLPRRLWQYTAAPLEAKRFAEYADPGGDYDLPSKNDYGDYQQFLGTYLGGDSANFGKPGYEQGSAFIRGEGRVQPLQVRQNDAYYGMNVNENTRYYGSQQNAQNVAFKMNNPLTMAKVPVGQSQILAAQQQPPAAPSRPQAVRTPSMPTARSSRLGGY